MSGTLGANAAGTVGTDGISLSVGATSARNGSQKASLLSSSSPKSPHASPADDSSDTAVTRTSASTAAVGIVGSETKEDANDGHKSPDLTASLTDDGNSTGKSNGAQYQWRGSVACVDATSRRRQNLLPNGDSTTTCLEDGMVVTNRTIHIVTNKKGNEVETEGAGHRVIDVPVESLTAIVCPYDVLVLENGDEVAGRSNEAVLLHTAGAPGYVWIQFESNDIRATVVQCIVDCFAAVRHVPLDTEQVSVDEVLEQLSSASARDGSPIASGALTAWAELDDSAEELAAAIDEVVAADVVEDDKVEERKSRLRTKKETKGTPTNGGGDIGPDQTSSPLMRQLLATHRRFSILNSQDLTDDVHSTGTGSSDQNSDEGGGSVGESAPTVRFHSHVEIIDDDGSVSSEDQQVFRKQRAKEKAKLRRRSGAPATRTDAAYANRQRRAMQKHFHQVQHRFMHQQLAGVDDTSAPPVSILKGGTGAAHNGDQAQQQQHAALDTASTTSDLSSEGVPASDMGSLAVDGSAGAVHRLRRRALSKTDISLESLKQELDRWCLATAYRLVKHGRKGKPHTTVLSIEDDILRWKRRSGGLDSGRGGEINLLQVEHVVRGCDSDVFRRAKRKRGGSTDDSLEESHCFSLLLPALQRSLDFECQSEAERNTIFDTLELYLAELRQQQPPS